VRLGSEQRRLAVRRGEAAHSAGPILLDADRYAPFPADGERLQDSQRIRHVDASELVLCADGIPPARLSVLHYMVELEHGGARARELARQKVKPGRYVVVCQR
jgi:hypothetical protein